MCVPLGNHDVLSVPTIKDRVQVLLEPQDKADLELLRKEERRSAGQMGAILIAEAIAARKLAGTFVPDRDIASEELNTARLRRTAKQMGKGVNDLIEKEEEKGGKEMSASDLLTLLQKAVNGSGDGG